MSDSSNFVDLQKYEILRKIGSGAFSEVFLVKEKSSDKFYAAKILNNKIDEENIKDENTFLIFREIKLISSLNHPSIIGFQGFSPTDFKNKPRPTIITEYIPNGTLSDILELEQKGLSPKCWDDTRKLINIYGIACGLLYLHSNNIIHRDMKPDNILMDEYLFPKIADFGLSKTTVSTSESMNIQSQNNMKGTPIYMSPEVLQEMKYTPACDVYAFSLITYEILSGQKPFTDLNFSQLALKVGIKGFRPKLNKSIPKSFRNLLEMCWDQKPECRPTMNEVVDMLKNDETFITETIDQQKFYDYVDYIDNYKSSFELNRTFHFDDFINKNNKNNSFEKIKIIEEDEETTNKKDNHEENIITKEKVDENENEHKHEKKHKSKKKSESEKKLKDISKYRINYLDFEKIERINEQIVYYNQKSTSLESISKVIENPLKKGKVMRKFIKTVEIWSMLNHPAVVPFIGYSDHKNRGSIYLKYMSNESLDVYINKQKEDQEQNSPLNFTQKLIISYGIACAIEYLHSLNIVHQNIKMSNVLLDENLYPYLTDFKLVGSDDLNLEMTIQDVPFVNAPEFYQDFNKYNQTKPLDIYSYGLFLFELWSGEKPFSNIKNFHTILSTVLRGQMPYVRSGNRIPDVFNKMIEKCLSLNPDNRPDLTKICDFYETDFLSDSEYESFFDHQVFENYIKFVGRVPSST